RICVYCCYFGNQIASVYCARNHLCGHGAVFGQWGYDNRCWCVSAERISNLPVRALIQVCGVQFQHQRPSRCVLHQARAVNCAVKHRHVIVGIQNCNSYQRCPGAFR
uniref:Uncharacterized protein n=1 Tax=Oreochromis aureus TaxID=47969 RepID=A0A668VA30_OREAU